MNDYILFKNLDGKYLTLPELLKKEEENKEDAKDQDADKTDSEENDQEKEDTVREVVQKAFHLPKYKIGIPENGPCLMNVPLYTRKKEYYKLVARTVI